LPEVKDTAKVKVAERWNPRVYPGRL